MDKGEIVLYQSQDGKISDEDSTVANFTTVQKSNVHFLQIVKKHTHRHAKCPVRLALPKGDRMLVEKKMNPQLRRLSRQACPALRGQNFGRENVLSPLGRTSLTGQRDRGWECRFSTNTAYFVHSTSIFLRQ